MPPLKGGNANIYGADDNTFAESIASSALTTGLNSEGVWGSNTDSRADSWDGPKEPQPGDVTVIKNLKAGAGDDGNMDSDYSKVTPRHRKPDLSAEDGITTPPKRFSGRK